MGARLGRSTFWGKVNRVLCAFVVTLLAFGSVAYSHEGATGVVKVRMVDMKKIGRAMKRIDDRIRSKRNLGDIAEQAADIRSAAARMPSQYPHSSRNDPHTEATKAVWERWPEFVLAAQLLEKEAEKLAAMAISGHQTAITGQFQSVTRACSGCHQAFRSKS